MQEHAAQAAYMRSVFDPELIEQELRHELFDPSGLFLTIGRTLKSHCAPMRDRAVENMIAVAQSCAPSGGGSKADAVKAVRLCMDILEFMKLVSCSYPTPSEGLIAASFSRISQTISFKPSALC